MPEAETKALGRAWLNVIAVFKLVKAATLIALGIGALALVHKDVTSELERLIGALSLDPGSHILHMLIGKASGLDDRRLEEIGLGTFIYAGVFICEGVGLLFDKRWAEYLTIGVTISFIPFEIYEVFEHLTATRVFAIAVNVAVVGYLVYRVRRERALRRHGDAAGKA